MSRILENKLMKKSAALFFIFFEFFCSCFILSASEIEKKFVRGNIKEKIEAVQNSEGNDALKMGIKGIDYALSNLDSLGSDSELASLAEASMLAITKQYGTENINKSLSEENSKKISDKLLTIFNVFDDENVKITAVESLSAFKDVKWNGTVDALNDYLEARYKENHPGNLLIGNIITTLGNIGNSRSFSLVYNIWLNNVWPEYSSASEKSLASLAENSDNGIQDSVKAIFLSDNDTILKFLTIVLKYDNDKNNFKENLAESALSFAINNVESSQEFSSNFFLIQKLSLETLSQAKWSHAQNIVAKNFDVAKKEYEMKIISDDEFIEIINLTAKFSSPEIAEAFSKLLGEFNSKAENTEIPSEPVVLALINSLGEMGAKTAFDNLLNTTYLNYSAKVIDAAKEALAKLKW